jgi:G:T/U-mismatch repair DNA glycosylase
LWIVGHNASELAASSGYCYGNPRNAMARHLVESGIFPRSLGPQAGESWGEVHARILAFQDVSPSAVGVGFTDVAIAVNNDAASVDVRSAVATSFLPRIQNALARTRRLLEADIAVRRHADVCVRDLLSTTEGDGVGVEGRVGAEDPAPRIVAFTSKTLFLGAMKGFEDLARRAGAESGAMSRLEAAVGECMDADPPEAVPLDLLPSTWTSLFPHTRVFVLDSTSGRNARHAARRERGFRALSAAVHALPWPPLVGGGEKSGTND